MNYKKILIVRVDRLGDVILSTPVIQAVREALPSSYIAFMTRPYTSDVVVGNPCLNDVIVYDKDGRHKSFISTIFFAFGLRKYKFDLALILHSTARANFIAFLAGIPRRIGYTRKAGWFLTDKLPYVKWQGTKHEIDYTLDVVRAAGINFNAKNIKLFMPVDKADEDFAASFLSKNNVSEKDKLACIHPAAGCVSRIWPAKKFCELADRLITDAHCKVIILGIKDELKYAEAIKQNMSHEPIIAKDFTIRQTAALLKRCSFLVSTDTGPAHIASAVGTPCITIFGRKQAGLGPVRWKPIGKDNVIFHKDVGCAKCAAHKCMKNFLCLDAVTTDEVLDAAKKFI